MDLWNILEYAAWALSALFAILMLVDLFRIDPTYDERLAHLVARRRDRADAGTPRDLRGTIDGHTTTATRGPAGERLRLLRVLGPVHVWALGVGIVLVGEYMGWNFSVGKGGMIAGLVACWVAGLLYTCVAMIDSEVTSTVAAAGGQYAQAKHIVGPLMAFNVGLFLVLAYTMLEAGNAITIGFLLDTVANMQGHEGLNQRPFIILTVMFLAWLNYRGVLATLNFNFVITAIAFIAIVILFLAVQFGASAIPLDFTAVSGRAAALRLGRHPRGAAFRALVLSRHRGHDAGGRGSPLAAALAALRHDGRHHHAGHRRDPDLVCLLRPHPVGVSRPGRHAAVRCGARHRQPRADGAALHRHDLLHASPRRTAASTTPPAPGSRWAATTTCRSGSAPFIRGYRTPYRSIVFLVPIALIFALGAPLDQVITFSILSGLLGYTFMSFNMVMFRRKWPLGSIKRGYVHPFHPLPAMVLLRPLRRDLRRDLPRLRHTAHRDDVLLHPRLALVPLLALPLRAARRPVHDALAAAAGATERPGRGASPAEPETCCPDCSSGLSLSSSALACLFGDGARAIIARAIRERASLLDGLSASLDGAAHRIGADGFPTLTGRLPDRRQSQSNCSPTRSSCAAFRSSGCRHRAGARAQRQRAIDRRARASDRGGILFADRAILERIASRAWRR